MKNKIRCTALFLSMVLMMAACGAEPPAPTNAPPETSVPADTAALTETNAPAETTDSLEATISSELQTADAVLLGQWQIYGLDYTISVYENGVLTVVSDGVQEDYTYQEDETGLMIYDQNQPVDHLSFDLDGKMYFDDFPDQWLLPLEQIPACESELYGLAPNWDFDGQMISLDNSILWTNDTSCGTMSGDWRATLISDEYNDDGTRTIEAEIRWARPLKGGEHYEFWMAMYDYDTGDILMLDDTFARQTNTVEFSHPNGYAVMEISVDVTDVEKEDLEGYISAKDLYMTITVPEWYTGLMFAALAVDPENNVYECGATHISDEPFYSMVANGMRLSLCS